MTRNLKGHETEARVGPGAGGGGRGLSQGSQSVILRRTAFHNVKAKDKRRRENTIPTTRQMFQSPVPSHTELI